LVNLLNEANKIREDIVNLRRQIHMRPELSMEEYKTSELVKNLLNSWGIETKRVAGTGIVGLLKGKGPGKTVALRADMDALPIPDKKNVEYASREEGKMHACGHDAHTAGLLGAALLLSRYKEYFPGQVKFLFQPAEEKKGGALPMIKEGVMENPKVDGVFGLHCNPGLQVGKIGVTYGKAYASSDIYEICIKGKGTHGAEPHKGIDAIAVGAQIVTALQNIVSRNTDPVDAAVVTIGEFHAGYQKNIVADRAELSGIIRTLDPKTREKTKETLIKLVTGIATAMGAEAEIQMTPSYPSLINDNGMVDLVLSAGKKLIGENNVIVVEKPTMGVEDFAYFAQLVPAAFFQLGVGNEAKGIIHPLHNSLFDIDEDALPIASAILSSVAVDFLNKN
jgi:amidohydrolase